MMMDTYSSCQYPDNNNNDIDGRGVLFTDSGGMFPIHELTFSKDE